MICYASNIGLEILSISTEWHADGTFKSAPRKYKQLYHIHAWYKAMNNILKKYVKKTLAIMMTYYSQHQRIKNGLLSSIS